MILEGGMSGQRSLFLSVVFVMLVGIMFSGCSKKTVSGPGTGDSSAMGPTESLETQVVAGDNIMEGRTSGPMLPVYFDFDASMVRDDQVERVETNADFLKKNPGVKIRIEGNCDPRGTKEYNLALGERRALSAQKYLVNLGVDASRMNTVSWGEEKLLLYGHDELSWAQNRRDDFVIVK
jgi:peptidoglycan-associated lipoprotein